MPGTCGKAHHKGRGMIRMDPKALSRLFVRLPPFTWDVLSLKCRQNGTKGSLHPCCPSSKWQATVCFCLLGPSQTQGTLRCVSISCTKNPQTIALKNILTTNTIARSSHSKWIWTVQSRKKGLFKTVINHVPSEVSDMQTRNAKSEPSAAGK